jgi:GAF domain-containing protein
MRVARQRSVKGETTSPAASGNGNGSPSPAGRRTRAAAAAATGGARPTGGDLGSLRAERDRTAKVQAALYRIAEAASAAQDLQEFYRTIHGIVGELMYAENFYIALYDAERERMNYPYFVDTVDEDLPDPNAWEPIGVGQAVGTTAYALRQGRPILMHPAEYTRLIAAGEVAPLGVTTDESSWLGVPLKAEGQTLGLLAVQSYTKEHQYTQADVDLLSFVGQHVASALTRARAIEETRQRNAELALVNEIGLALAKQLDFDSVIELVGERVRSIVAASSIFIGLVDEAQGLIHFPYEIADGKRIRSGSIALGAGLSSIVMRERRPLRLSTTDEQLALGAVLEGIIAASWLGVPIESGDRVIGLLAVETFEPYAYSESDERLLSTLASSMGVALENARLFDQTKGLLAETEQRNDELSLVNEIGLALARQLDFDAIITLVGDRIRAIFQVETGSIALFDAATNTIATPYFIDQGRRLSTDSMPLGPGLTSHVITTGASLRLNSSKESEALGAIVVGSDEAESWLGVPILAGDRVLGVISLERRPRYAFSESDERLLSTLASSMGVALENARLFDETKRLLGETEQRNDELALVNEIGLALAKQLEFTSIVDLVGDRIREIFKVSTGVIGLYDAANNLISTPYSIDQGERTQWPDRELGPGLMSEVIRTRQPLRLGSNEDSSAHGALIMGTEDAESWLGVPILAADRVLGAIALERMPQHAFSESDERLLSTLASSMGTALENARLFDETKRLLTETEQRNEELALVNEIGAGLSKQLDFGAIVELVGDRLARTFRADDMFIGLYDRERNEIATPYELLHGRRVHGFPVPFGAGLTSRVLTTREPIRIGTAEEAAAHGAINAGYAEQADETETETETESWLGVPILAGDQAIGVVGIRDRRRHAYSESDERVVRTIASNLGVALENARLFDETKRLLAETDERAAELGIINSVQEGLARKLDYDSIARLVGERLDEIFDAEVVTVALLDGPSGYIRFPYFARKGERLEVGGVELGEGLSSVAIKTRRAVRLGTEADMVAHGALFVPDEPHAESYLAVPVLANDVVVGAISVQEFREHAFTEAHERLLSTLASSMGVALENARLFDETTRLLAETEQRNAELAVINEIGTALARRRACHLDLQCSNRVHCAAGCGWGARDLSVLRRA